MLVSIIKIHTYIINIVSKHQSLHGLESQWRPDVFWPPCVALERRLWRRTQGPVGVALLGVVQKVRNRTRLRPSVDARPLEELLSNLKGAVKQEAITINTC